MYITTISPIKVADFVTNWKAVYDFLLENNKLLSYLAQFPRFHVLPIIGTLGGYFALQGDSRSPILVPIESSH